MTSVVVRKSVTSGKNCKTPRMDHETFEFYPKKKKNEDAKKKRTFAIPWTESCQKKNNGAQRCQRLHSPFHNFARAGV